MNIHKAIELKKLELLQWPAHINPDSRKATKLSLEAMKAIKDFRNDWSGNRFHLLPGETDTPPPRDSAAAFASTKP